MLPIGAHFCFDYAVGSFASYFTVEPFVFVVPDTEAANFVEQRCATLGLRRLETVIVDHVTAGQAETVEVGLLSPRVQEMGAIRSGPFTIFNIDTFRINYTHFAGGARSDHYLEVFQGEGDGWSFVQALDASRVARTTEKLRVSSLCSTGLYRFKSKEDFLWALDQERRAPSQPLTELYVAPLYNHLLQRGDTVLYSVVPNDDIVFSGVPIEYEAVLKDAAVQRRLEQNLRIKRSQQFDAN